MVKPVLFLIFLCLISVTYANADNYGFDSQVQSFKRSADSIRNESSPSKFKYYKLIAPSSPIVIGSLTLYVANAEELDMTISDWISSGHGKLHFDDYLQYSPAAIMWGLNAFGGPNLRPYHKFKQQTTILAMSAITSLIIVQGTKEFVGRRRPDTGAKTSFPSGHTATAFMCAEMLHQEFGHHSPWISVLGYSIAAVTGYMRIYNERHYLGDIIAGAGIGMLSARLAYWVAPGINRILWGSETGYDKDLFSASLSPCVIGESYGVNFSITF